MQWATKCDHDLSTVQKPLKVSGKLAKVLVPILLLLYNYKRGSITAEHVQSILMRKQKEKET